MHSFFKEKINHKGMTLIEVLVVIVLLAVILVPAVNALTATNRIWSHNDAINPRIAQANTAMIWISREIREAAQPSKAVDSVVVEDGGQRLVIYRYNENSSEWEKIIYQSIDNKLNKITLSDADPATVINTAIPGENDPDWTTLLEGITSNPVFNRPVNSRAVEINLQVSDSGQANPRFTPFNLASTYMIRSREVGAITGEPVPDDTELEPVDVHKVVVNPSSTTLKILIPWKKHEQIVSATIWPANATDKSVTWESSNEAWVRVEYDPANSLTARIVLNKESGLLPWPIPTVTAKPNGGGESDKCTVFIIY